MFITEALHPYNVFKEKGFEVDFVSETGTYQPDWLSMQEDWLKDDDKKAWEGNQGEFRKKLDAMAKAGDVDPDQVSYLCFLPLASQACAMEGPVDDSVTAHFSQSIEPFPHT